MNIFWLIIRDIIVTLISFYMIFRVSKILIGGLRSGLIHHTDTVSVYSKKKEPFKFWFAVLFFILLLVLAIYAWVDAIFFVV